ncbi:cytochrome P450 [Phascolomyces articulosus]|uniref:Cytochrome P450 n=1 Tax=Phascolomyces articulosus TaxID=60185 RepID=A0AAD5K303_9FUNG|nr:cytochrome P450 [Phascolomyces articulosus]
MSNQTKDRLISTTKFAYGAAVGLFGMLVLKYPDCAIFHDVPENIPRIKGFPLIGSIIQEVANYEKYYGSQHEQFTKLNTLTMVTSAVGLPLTITTIDPKNIEHFLRVNFSNYVKSDHFRTSLKGLFGHSIVLSEGHRWAYHRKAAVRIFSTKRLEDYFAHVIVTELNVMVKKVLDNYALDGAIIDLQDLFLKYTMDSFVMIAFGKNLNTLTSKEVVPVSESFDKCVQHVFNMSTNPFTPIIDKFNNVFRGPQTKSINQHYDTLNDFAYTIIAERKDDLKNGHSFNDLLSVAMEQGNESGEEFSDEDLRDLIVSSIVAARDANAAALSWGLLCIIQHPEVQVKLLQEIENYLPENKNDQQQQPLLFYEILRLYPPATVNFRDALNDDVWPDGTKIRKGNTVSINLYAQARSPKVWGDDCNEFKPERWLQPDGRLRHESQAKWPIFNVSPRACIGQNLATLESITAIVTLVQRYKFSLVPNQNFEYSVSLVMAMKHGLKVHVQNREN